MKKYDVNVISNFFSGRPHADTSRAEDVSRTYIEQLVKTALESEPDILVVQIKKR